MGQVALDCESTHRPLPCLKEVKGCFKGQSNRTTLISAGSEEVKRARGKEGLLCIAPSVVPPAEAFQRHFFLQLSCSVPPTIFPTFFFGFPSCSVVFPLVPLFWWLPHYKSRSKPQKGCPFFFLPKWVTEPLSQG